MQLNDSISEDVLVEFQELVFAKGRELYRDLPWRNTYDPYAIWISEVMLQQTQVARVLDRWQRWLMRFPSVEALAAQDSADVLEEWQGLGYNRRALSVHKAAQQIVNTFGVFPLEYSQLVSLPGIGPATAAGIRAFSAHLHGVYLETNVRCVFLHELFPEAQQVPDKVLIPYVESLCPPSNAKGLRTPRSWYYALLDYGNYLKKTIPNPSRRSATHVKQSKFEGSHRQKRAWILRLFLDGRAVGRSELTIDKVQSLLNEFEVSHKRNEVDSEEVQQILNELVQEGFIKSDDLNYYI